MRQASLKAGREGRCAKPVAAGVGNPYLSIESAAARLSTSPTALRARCRRNARREGRSIVAHLGGGIVAIKFGISWRVRFPD